MTKDWSEYELSLLNNKDISLVEVSKITGRNYNLVKTKASDLKITRNNRITTKHKRIYRIWCAIKTRCYNKNAPSYKNYGGRNIQMCPEWEKSSESFIIWSLNNGYNESLSIDRINNDGDYSPENCRWVDDTQQANNKRNNTKILAFGEEKTLAEWSKDERCVVSYTTLRARKRKNKMSFEDMITSETKPCIIRNNS